MKKEVLSPVGNMEVLKYAIMGGADAVYLAGNKYGARKFATNFNELELEEAVRYAHLYGVLVYVTVNTLIYEEEVNDFISYLKYLESINVDALIMQDYGMINRVRKEIPNIQIHASTQCHNHNKSIVKLWYDLGLSRIVMAREMSIGEINDIDIDIEIETFVYGALCVSYSGCCLFSSLNGGRSGNRGECVGSCRLKYSLVRNGIDITEDKYLLSLRDLNTVNNIKDLINSRINSFKIEGRMKSKYYVYYVTKMYRDLLDGNLDNIDEKDLKLLFNREFTEGYLFNSNNISNIKSPNHIGIALGKVIDIKKGKIGILLDEDLCQEDGIRFVSDDKGMIVNMLYDNKMLLVNKVLKGNVCYVDNKVNLKNNSLVLKTISRELEKDIDNYIEKKIFININVIAKLGEKLKIVFSDGVNEVVEHGDIIGESLNRSTSDKDVKEKLSKLGNTPFKVNNFDVLIDDNIFIPISCLNNIRRVLVDKLIKIRESNKIINNTVYNFKKSDLIYNNSSSICLNVLARNREQVDTLIKLGVNNIYIDDYDLYRKYCMNDNIYLRTPRINRDIKYKNERLLMTDIGGIYANRFDNLINSDYSLNVTNSESIVFLKEMGIDKVCLSPEISDDTIERIMNNTKYKDSVEVIIYGRYELMVMKYCPLKGYYGKCILCRNSKDSYALKDSFGNLYPLLVNDCITRIMHYKVDNRVNDISFYKNIGIKNFRIDLFNESSEEVIDIINKCHIN